MSIEQSQMYIHSRSLAHYTGLTEIRKTTRIARCMIVTFCYLDLPHSISISWDCNGYVVNAAIFCVTKIISFWNKKKKYQLKKERERERERGREEEKKSTNNLKSMPM